MSAAGRKVPGGRKGLPRATASHFSGDLDRQARLAVEGSKIGLDRNDAEAIVCARWAAFMEEETPWHE